MMIKMKKIARTAACLAVVALLSPPAHAISYLVGNTMPTKTQLGKDSVVTDPPTQSVTRTWARNMGIKVAVHTLGPTPTELVAYNWTALHMSDDTAATAAGTSGSLYCRKEGNNTSLDVRHGYGTPYPIQVDGHPIWKTSVDGLYFALEITSMLVANTTNVQPAGAFFVKEAPFQITGTSTGPSCDKSPDNEVVLEGGIGFGVRLHLYADDKFTPQESIDATVLTFPDAGYDLRVTNDDYSLSGAGHSLDFKLDKSGFSMVWPTCSANTISSNGKTVSAVDLGTYYPKQIINKQTTTVPFEINMSGCTYVKGIEVTLNSNNIGAHDKTLLTNKETEDAATGVGVQVKGLKNTVTTNDMVIIPGNSASVYKDVNPQASDSSNNDKGKDAKVLKFNATLLQDGSADITPGKFTATGTFTLNYP